MQRPYLIIAPNPAAGTFVVRLVSADGVLAEEGSLMDAQRIARSLSSWTHLPVYEVGS